MQKNHHLFLKKINIIRKNGFTLIEIMVVIAIIGILAVSTSNINFNRQTGVEKRDRFVNQIVSIINTQKINSLIGRGIKVGTNIVNVDYSYISISTGSIKSSYISGVNTQSGEIIAYPFYGEKLYDIKDIKYISKDGGSGSVSAGFGIKNINGVIEFSGSTVEKDAIKLIITAGYKPDYKTITLDRRTGQIIVK